MKSKSLKMIVVIMLTMMPFSLQAQQISQYDAKMLRLSEILGSLHYLRNLCGAKTTQWRDQMTALIDAEKPNATRKTRLYAAFNDAYRAFSENYHSCTLAATIADQQYVAEGKALSKELLTRFGN